jgi:RNA polymerase sigma factor (sigma-70 family)
MATTAPPIRPSRAEIEPAALDLIRRRGAEILSTARRYALTPEDAEDAYQRGLEILLTKAPSTHEDDLVPWLKTVVKHEAFALRKQRERHGVPTDQDELTPDRRETHDHVERIDKLQRGAEALKHLKPAEVQCMLLLAEGYSYKQICEATGFSYTKVNRCLHEGRQSFLRRVDGIEAGEECARLRPLMSAAADGEASADDMLALKRHMRGCLACRAFLRESRRVPARVAALAPTGVLLAPHDTAEPTRLHALGQWLHDKLALFAIRGQELIDAATTHKTIAVAASAAALAGGGAAAGHTVEQAPKPAPAIHHVKRTAPKRAPTPTIVRAPERAPHKRSHNRKPIKKHIAPTPAPTPAPQQTTVAKPVAPTPAPKPAQPKEQKTEPKADGRGEFGP